MLDQLAQQRHSGFDARQLQVFPGLVDAIDIAKTEHQNLTTKLLKIKRLNTKCHRLRAVPNQTLDQTHQLDIGKLFEKQYNQKERTIVDAHLILERQRLQLTTNRLTQLLRIHAQQQTQIELQHTLTTNTIKIIVTGKHK